jgi:putative resolvase
MRFGAEYVEAALTAQERKLMVMESSEVNDDLVQDMIAVLTSFCARLYGRRSARNKAKKHCMPWGNKTLLRPEAPAINR